MNEWLHNLPVWLMALVIFAIVYLATGGIFAITMALARSERVHVFKRLSPGLLSPLGTIFGLLVVFSVVQVWSDIDRAKSAVDREASAIRMVVLTRRQFSGRTGGADSKPAPPPYRRSGFHRVAHDGETSGFFNGRTPWRWPNYCG